VSWPVRGPRAKPLEGFFSHHLNRGDAALPQRLLQFAIDERIAESNLGGVLNGIRKINPSTRAQ
jgi:hypothetical protein